MPGLWPGGKELLGKKHLPSHFGFRISDFGFWVFLFQSAFRNLQSAIPMARPFHGIKSASWFLHAMPLPSGLATSRKPPSGGAYFNPL
jgi:hypothetical protein